MLTKQQVQAALDVMVGVASVVREFKQIPSGELYARLMDKLPLESYESIIRQLERWQRSCGIGWQDQRPAGEISRRPRGGNPDGLFLFTLELNGNDRSEYQS